MIQKNYLINKWEGAALPYRTPINKRRRNEGNRKSPLEHHSNNCYRQDNLMDANTSGANLKQKQDICIRSKYLPKNT